MRLSLRLEVLVEMTQVEVAGLQFQVESESNLLFANILEKVLEMPFSFYKILVVSMRASCAVSWANQILHVHFTSTNHNH